MWHNASFKFVTCILIMTSIMPSSELLQIPIIGPIFENAAQVLKNYVNLATGSIKFLSNAFSNKDELNDTTPTENQAFDFIVVGAGSAGAAIASRLSEVSNISVLLIEAGISENKLMDVPLAALFLEGIKFINWDYKIEPSSTYCLGFSNHQCKQPRGKVMGGTSVLNGMVATRGSHHDYDNWAKLGCDGWSWKDVFPIFKKMENFEVHGKQIEKEFHATGGPLNIVEAPYHTDASRAFLEAGKERGFPIVDYNGKEMIGYSFYQTTMKNGERISSNKAYLYPVKNRKNLHVTKYSRATKILIDPKTKIAYGVELVKWGKKIRVLAKKEVILSAGTMESTKLLMLSGIGPAKHLQEKNIKVIKDAPVGENLMDHVSYYGFILLVNSSVTIVSKDFFNPTNSAVADYLNKRQGPLTVAGGAEAVGFVNIGNLSERQGWPDFEIVMMGVSYGQDLIAPRLQNIATSYDLKYLKPTLNRQSFMIIPTLLHPKSRGKILLKSNRYQDDPKIIPKYFDHPDDMKRMILGIREALKLIQTKALQKYNTRLPSYPVPGCEEHKSDSDEYWDCAVRTFTNSLWHLAGTCKMGAKNDSTAVVDPRLKVIGIERLRVADSSIIPVLISAHTNLPAMMIGEKLAQMVKEDWNLI